MANNTSITYQAAYPPEPLLVDRIQLILLIIMFIIGAPINLVSLTKLRSGHSLARSGRLALLRLHLNISDLMVIFIYVTSTACHGLTYQWRGGNLLCKLVKFLNSTSFQLSSNIVICVALDRLFTILCGTVFYKKYVNRHPARYVRFCLIISWATAIGINVSQFFVWVTVAPFPETSPDWVQCVTIWSAQAHFDRMSAMGKASLASGSPTLKWLATMDQHSYNTFQLAAVFWIPATMIMICYTILIIYMYRMNVQRKSSTRLIANVSSSEINTTKIDRTSSLGIGRYSETHRISEEISFLTSQSADRTKIDLLPVAIHRMRSKTFHVAILLISAYLLCWFPYNFLALWHAFDAAGYRRNATSMKFLNVLIVFNSVVNPFLYGTLKCKVSICKKRRNDKNNVI